VWLQRVHLPGNRKGYKAPSGDLHQALQQQFEMSSTLASDLLSITGTVVVHVPISCGYEGQGGSRKVCGGSAPSQVEVKRVPLLSPLHSTHTSPWVDIYHSLHVDVLLLAAFGFWHCTLL
jgi:hypothetical protein